MSYAKVCAQCERDFISRRPDAETDSEECKYQRWIETNLGTPQPVTHPLDDARGQMREGRTSAQWELVAREKVARTLLDTGEFTADDLADLNIPVDYRRHIHGAATGYFAGAEPFMDFVGRQKSSRPSRKGGKNDLYRINAKGLRELPGLLRDPHSRLYTLAGSGGDDSSRVGTSVAPSKDQEPSVGLTTAAQPGNLGPAESGRSGEPDPEVLQLDDAKRPASSMYDPMEGKAA